MKDRIHDMERKEEEGNLYSSYKAARMPRKERDNNLERFLHPDLVANKRASIEKFSRKTFKRGLSKNMGEQ